jgi:DNA-binding GntR family transcriptional regulator
MLNGDRSLVSRRAEPGRTAGPDPDATPLNERIAQALTQAIAAGEYELGSTLPPEAALCAQFGASRFTVREALRKLAELGLIETRQGAGSRIVSRTARAGYSHVFRDLQDLFEYARDTRIEIWDSAVAAVDAIDANDIQAPAGSRWLRIVGLRWDAERTRPISYVTVFVHSRFADLLHDVRDAKGAIYGLVEARSGEEIAEAIQQISAGVMPAVAAKALGCRRGATGMRFVRRYCDASGGVMLTSINWHPAERFSYTMRIKRGDWRS